MSKIKFNKKIMKNINFDNPQKLKSLFSKKKIKKLSGKEHKIISAASIYKNKKQIFELSLSEFKKFSNLIEKDVMTFIKPEEAVRTKDSIGGTSPKQVLTQIKKAKKLLSLRS